MTRRSPPTLIVTFHKVDDPRPFAWWEARRPTGGAFRGGYMPIGRGIIPHDLGHMVTEASRGIDDGVWGLLARGATFRKGTDRRPTKPGRALIAANRESLNGAEHAGNHHHWAWATGADTPIAPAFDRVAEAWRAVPNGGTLTIHWPTLELTSAAEQTRR